MRNFTRSLYGIDTTLTGIGDAAEKQARAGRLVPDGEEEWMIHAHLDGLGRLMNTGCGHINRRGRGGLSTLLIQV